MAFATNVLILEPIVYCASALLVKEESKLGNMYSNAWLVAIYST